ncbi:MAG: ligase-associated DNA damage response endonuclease PdeM, partial [Acidobacteriota bacterium]
MKIDVAGTSLELLPERAAFWPERATLFVADTHWGKAAAFRAHSIPVPFGTTDNDLARLTTAIEKTGCRRIVLLGDALHAREGRAPKTFAAVAEWRARHAGVEIVLVRGNHDRRAGDPPEELGIRCVNAPLAEAPFVYLHHPAPSPGGYALAGHTHPAVKLRGRGLQRATLPCFVFT